MERIFASFKDSGGGNTSSYDPGDPSSTVQYIHAMITDSRDYEGSVLAGDRDYAQKYYYGLLPTLDGDENPYSDTTIIQDPHATYAEIAGQSQDEANRSRYVSTDVRDAVMMMLPSLIRLFGASESPVELVPRTAAESDMAEQATNYVNYTFWNDNAGFLILYGAFKDALTVRTGYVKWWTDTRKEIKRKEFSNITAQQIQQILSEDPTAKLIEVGNPVQVSLPNSSQSSSSPPSPPMAAPMAQSPGSPPAMGSSGSFPPSPSAAGPQSSPGAAGGQGSFPSGLLTTLPAFDHVVVEYEVSKPLTKVCGVPPEEMRIDRYARTFRESRLVGHERVVPVDELTAMGYAREDLLDYIQGQSTPEFTQEAQLRNPGRMMSTRVGDGVKYGEWYIKVDMDGDGFPELRYICTMGENADIISNQPANRIKFALFSCDPISHTIVGDSLADYIIDLQRLKTNLARAVLDSAAESINPKTVINELNVNVDDALNDDLGAVVRVRGDPNAAVMYTNTPFLGQAIMPVLDMVDAVLQRRTGLSDAARGLDPKQLQSSTQIGVEAIINGQQERTELVARVLAETGYRDLFTGLFNEICENPSPPRALKINGEWTDYDTSTFDASMGVEVNPTLGKGSDTVRLMTLQQIKQDQQAIVTQMGLSNPICGVVEMMNTQTDMLKIANIKNVNRYFKMPNPQQLQQLYTAPKEPDAMTLAAQAQYQKVKADAAEALGDQNLRKAQQDQDHALAMAQLREKTLNDQAKLDLQATQIHAQHTQTLGKMAADMFKTAHDGAVDVHTAHVQAASDQAVAAQQAATAANQQDGGGG
jgi:hypothetical protein